MAASTSLMLAINIEKCDHQKGCQLMRVTPTSSTAADIFKELHGPVDPQRYGVKFVVGTSLEGTSFWEIDGCIPLFEVSAFGVKVLKMTCTTLPEGILASSLEKISNEATKKTVDAFQVLMMKGKALPTKKVARYIKILNCKCKKINI
ncbi:hypothetical protein DPMN_048776 [Dreissena polymorpha]|uniref:Uncharacterized protein n=1 Tax=Dreissena polymorpha TaxID=45954 RepID=A0A9D4I2M6_DREPO|nr:hypothetical protein DPMN_048776 [Dreissena polymorpha]